MPPKFREMHYVGDRISFILAKLEQLDHQTILHIGCAQFYDIPDRCFHLKLKACSSNIYGIDLDEDGLRALKQYGVDNLYYCDAEKIDELNLNMQFDIIIAGEIIEHLNNAGSFLRNVTRLMHKGSKLILTTPNSFALRRHIWAYFNRESESENHTFLFHPHGIELLLSRFNLHITDFYTAYESIHAKTARHALANIMLKRIFTICPHFAESMVIISELNS